MGEVTRARILVVEDDPEAAGGADRYLEKPLRVDQLIAMATALIGTRRHSYPDTPGHDTLPT